MTCDPAASAASKHQKRILLREAFMGEICRPGASA
jgi:hypothetical protein